MGMGQGRERERDRETDTDTDTDTERDTERQIRAETVEFPALVLQGMEAALLLMLLMAALTVAFQIWASMIRPSGSLNSFVWAQICSTEAMKMSGIDWEGGGGDEPLGAGRDDQGRGDEGRGDEGRAKEGELTVKGCVPARDGGR